MPVNLPIDHLYQRLRNQRVAVIATAAGYIPGQGAIVDLLGDNRQLDVRSFLALEHGLRGELQDGVLFDQYHDARSGKDVFSFYGKHGHSFTRDFLADIDTVVFHAQDVSHRAYTYKQALAATLQQINGTATRLVILDRPTPLAHLGLWGPLHPQFFPLPLPVGIALSLGELALLLRTQHKLDADVEVISCQGWQRQCRWQQTGLPWIPPSPNVPHLDSAYAYACTGLLQATTISEGRGTCKPFEYIGAPFVAPQVLVQHLKEARLPGVQWREIYFQPAFGKYAGETCGGTHLLFDAVEKLDPLRINLVLLQTFARLYPDKFAVLPALPNWLDGVSRSVQQWASLDINTLTATAQEQCREFAVQAHAITISAYGPVCPWPGH